MSTFFVYKNMGGWYKMATYNEHQNRNDSVTEMNTLYASGEHRLGSLHIVEETEYVKQRGIEEIKRNQRWHYR